MTDAEFEAGRQRIKAAVEKWLPALGLKWWQEVTIRYDRERFSQERNDQSPNAVAYARVEWQYLQATITFSVLKIIENENDDDDIDYIVRHELGHVLVNEMRMWAPTEMTVEKHDEAMKHEERVVTQLAQALRWVWDAAFKAGKGATNASRSEN